MADNIVGTKIVIDSDQAVQSVGSIKKQLKEATNDLVTMADKFGEGSKEAVTAAKRVAELRDRIGDAKSMADAFNPDAKFKAVSQSVQGIAGAFAAVQGAMATFGVESEDLQKSLLKVQGALALSEGLNTFLDTGIQGFKNLKTVAIDAFNGIKAAIGSSGIGLIVVALGSIVAYWDDIKAAMIGVSEEQDKLNTKTKENATAEKEKLDALGSQDNILKLQGKSEEDILKIKIKQTDQVIKSLQAQLQSQIVIENAQIKAAQRNKEILEGILRYVTAPISLLLKGIDMAGQAFGKNFGLEKGFYGGIAGVVFDPKDIKEKGDKANKELEKQILALQNTRAGYELSLKKGATGGKKSSEGGGKIEKIDLEPIENKQIDAVQRLNLAYKTLDATRVESTLKNKDLTEINAKLAENFHLDQKARFDESLKWAMDYTQSAQSLSDALYAAKLAGVEKGSKEEEAILRKQFEVNKKLQIAQTLISGFNGIVNALSAKSVFLEPTRSILNGINAAFIGATTAANVAKINQTQFGSTAGAMSSGGYNAGGSAPMSPTIPVQNTITTLNQGTINALGNQAIKAYVLESDVTNSQGRVTRILNSSRFK